MLDSHLIGAANYSPAGCKKHAYFSPWLLAQAVHTLPLWTVRSFAGP